MVSAKVLVMPREDRFVDTISTWIKDNVTSNDVFDRGHGKGGSSGYGYSDGRGHGRGNYSGNGYGVGYGDGAGSGDGHDDCSGFGDLLWASGSGNGDGTGQ